MSKRLLTSKRFVVTLAFQILLVAAFLIVPGAIAGPVTLPHTFTAGTTAVAAQVNANFAALATEVNDNDARITFLEDAAVVGDVETLCSMRGTVAANGTIVTGGGFTVSKGGPGQYTLTFAIPFFDEPAVLLSPHAGTSPTYRDPFTLATTGVSFTTRDALGVPVDQAFSVFVIGIR